VQRLSFDISDDWRAQTSSTSLPCLIDRRLQQHVNYAASCVVVSGRWSSAKTPVLRQWTVVCRRHSRLLLDLCRLRHLHRIRYTHMADWTRSPAVANTYVGPRVPCYAKNAQLCLRARNKN